VNKTRRKKTKRSKKKRKKKEENEALAGFMARKREEARPRSRQRFQGTKKSASGSNPLPHYALMK